MDDNVEDCPVCLGTFDDTLRRPRNLPCGHTLCTPCINELEEQGAVTCPTCRASYAVPEAGHFPINYIAEGLIKRLRGTRLAPAGFSRTTQSMLQEQEVRVLAAIRSCQEEQSQLADYLTTLASWGGRQQRLEDELQTLMDQSRSAREVVHGEEGRVERRQELVQLREQELHATLQALRTAATRQEAYDIIEDAGHLVQEQMSPEAEECLEVFPDVQAVTTVARMAEASSAALQAAAAALQAAAAAASSTAAATAGDCSLPAACSTASSIVDRVQALLAPPMTNKELPAGLLQTEKPPASLLQAKELLSLTPPARVLVEAGHVFAEQDVEGRVRRARLSLEGRRLHLYSLQDQDQEQDPTSITVQMSELLHALPPSEVFLDLAWPGNAARRVVIRLDRNTPRGRQMVLLCSGQLGPCLANTRLHAVLDKGHNGEFVVLGDYQTGNGRGGAALLPHLDKSREYWKSEGQGAVWGWDSDHALRGAQFSITTRNNLVNNVASVFGTVVSGLEVVKQAAQHTPITDVTVAECGVLFKQPLQI